MVHPDLATVCYNGHRQLAAECLTASDGTLPGQTGAGNADAFVRRYDTDGNEDWTDQFGTSRADHAYGVSVANGNVYVAGDTYGVYWALLPDRAPGLGHFLLASEPVGLWVFSSCEESGFLISAGLTSGP